MHKRSNTAAALLFAAAALLAPGAGALHAQAAAKPAALDSLAISALKARAIGPAVMGGRVSDIALDPTDPQTFYVGLGTGGVMKTTDGGATFSAIFTGQPVASIGAVAVAPSDSSVVWVGTGEANDRNSSQWGNGVYRSADAGATWTHVGLEGTKSIARIVVSPTDPKTAYVAAVGDLWQASRERGLYRTTDGGATWTKVLAAPAPYDDRVGAGDVAIDPQDPSTVYAALYARRRTPWSFTAGPAATEGKDLGGIFKSTDGGAHWTKLGGGLPSGTRRIGLAVYPKDPRIVYAIVETDAGGPISIDEVRSKEGGVFRSDDGGATWTRRSALDARAFYFSQIRVDPSDPDRVYELTSMVHVSENGGRTWREDRFSKVHPDNHALAIDAHDPRHLLLGTDGGIYQSWDGGALWAHLNRFAGGEFYRISLDSMKPHYRICGGLQDNINWVGPSQTDSQEGIRNSDWKPIDGGDGFYCVFGRNPDHVFTESQGGTVYRYDLATGEEKFLQPSPAEGQPAYRFHWNAPLIGSVHDPDAMYLAGNRVFKLTDDGERSRPISPDLSTQNVDRITATGSGAETYGVVYALAESPVQAGELWAGTDDGKLWITRDDGAHWTDLTASLPADAKGRWIQRIAPSVTSPDVAYVAVSAYRSGDDRPLLWRTADGGRSWRSVAGDLPADGPIEVVAEDRFNPDLLYVGTMFGLFASGDGGSHWVRFGGLPTVAVDDIELQPEERDLVIATHGRSLYIVDDVRPLEELTAAVRDSAAYLFQPPAAFGTNRQAGFADWNGGAVYRGENPPEGVPLDFWVKAYTGADVALAITDADGVPVANLSAPGVPGLGRVWWDLKPTSDVLTAYGGEGRLFVAGGKYTVTLTYGGVKMERTLEVTVAKGIETR